MNYLIPDEGKFRLGYGLIALMDLRFTYIYHIDMYSIVHELLDP